VQGFGSDPPAARTAAPSGDQDADRGRGDRGRRGGRRGGRRDGDDSTRERRDRPSDPQPAPTTAGPPTTTTTTASGFGTTASGPTDASHAEGIRKWAVSLIQEHDKNGNMMLEAAEQEALRRQSREADLNGDGTITLDELISHVSPKPAGNSTPATAKAAKSSVADASESVPPTRIAAKSYRFRSAKERLPGGLPEWFARKDANGDGQVAMNEYSRFWTDRTAAEFQRYDRDNDGVISPTEAR
jgi:Ca2+-binding EF-hand superfamily protein